MLIEVWSDVVCPWCYIGRRRLQQALAARTDLGDVQVLHRAFQLQPNAPRDHVEPTAQHLAEKYSVSPEQVLQMQATVTQAASTVGLKFNLEHTLSGNTEDAHRLLLWAQATGGQDALLEQMYGGYFTREQSLFDHAVLLDMAEQVGLDRAEAAGVLESDAFAEQVRMDGAEAAQLGATGVPFFVFDRKYGIAGAQSHEVFMQTLDAAVSGQ